MHTECIDTMESSVLTMGEVIGITEVPVCTLSDTMESTVLAMGK